MRCFMQATFLPGSNRGSQSRGQQSCVYLPLMSSGVAGKPPFATTLFPSLPTPASPQGICATGGAMGVVLHKESKRVAFWKQTH